MLKKALLGFAACTVAIAPAYAGISVSSVPGTDPYSGPTATFDFDSATPEWSGSIFTDSLASHRAQPFGSTGGYASTGIDAEGGINPAVLDLSAFYDITSISFLWGSIDDYNSVDFQDIDGNSLALFTGGSPDIMPASGGQTDPQSNRVVTFAITGADSGKVAKLVFSSGQNAFEFDNVAIGAVPEPASWAMMIAGFGLVGGAMRSRRSSLALA